MGKARISKYVEGFLQSSIVVSLREQVLQKPIKIARKK